MNSQPIQLALGSDQNYFCGLLVTAVSAARNCRADAPLSFNFLDGGITAESKAYLEQKCLAAHPSCTFRWLKIDTALFKDFPKFLDKGLMTYARLLLPEILSDCDQVIYCDVDFLWLADIAELWALRDDKILLQSVADGGEDHRKNETEWFDRHGYRFDPSKYFCAGMCLMNLAMMRNEGFKAKALQFIADNPDIKAHDQTTLNIYCYGRDDVRMIDNKWQLRTSEIHESNLSERPVLHYAADAPWRVVNAIHLLTDFHLLWFRTEATIRGISTWQALRERYSAWKIISSRLFFKIGSSSRLGFHLLRLAMATLAPSKSFDCLVPSLKTHGNCDLKRIGYYSCSTTARFSLKNIFDSAISSIRSMMSKFLPERTVAFIGNIFNTIMFRRELWDIYYFKKDLSIYIPEFTIQAFKRYMLRDASPKFWNMYLQMLIESGRYHLACKTFDLYHKLCPALPLTECFLNVSEFLVENNLSKKEKIIRSAALKKSLSIMHSTHPFYTLVSDKRVAVVGNGPSEVGSNNGAEIDQYDVVIRFNNYATDSQFAIDYGSKTTIRALGNNPMSKHYENVALEIYADDLMRIPLLQGGDTDSNDSIITNFITELEMDIKKGKLIDYVDTSIRAIYSDDLNMHPTTGLLLIEMLRHSKAKCVDVFGFSFLVGDKPPNTYEHYQNDIPTGALTTAMCHHRIDAEYFILRSMFNGRRLRIDGRPR